MAQIIIREKDLTGNPAATTFDVAFVPGLTTKKPTDEGVHWIYNKPYYVDSLSTFRSQFGSNPVELTGRGIPYVYSDSKGVQNDKLLEGFINGSDKTLVVEDVGVGNKDIPYSDISKIAGRKIVSFKSNTTVTIPDIAVGDEVKVDINGTATTKTVTSVDPLPEGSEPGTKQFVGEIYIDETDERLAVLQINASDDRHIYFDGGDAPLSAVVGGLTATVYGEYYFEADYDGYFFAGGDGVFDNGYIYASELLSAGIPIYYCPIEGTEARDVYNALEGTNGTSILVQLADRGTFNIKYITSGGYPTFEYNGNSIVSLMLQMAGANTDAEPTTDDYQDNPASDNPNGRGDAVAFIDHFEIDDRPLWGEGSVYNAVQQQLAEQHFLSFGAMFTPYANYVLQSSYRYTEHRGSEEADRVQIATTHYFPASFAYLTCLARQLNATIPSYEAVAGVARGSVKNIVFDATTNSYEVCTKDVLTNYIANHYNSMPQADGNMPISINGITQINPYGLVIYGTRTLAKKDPVDGVKATGILNIRNMVSDIKKQMYQSARRYMYSANNDALWINFRSSVIGLLNQMQQGYGIKSWSLKKDMAKSTKSSLYVLCSIQPVYPVEKFDITIEITDEDVEVNEA